MSTTSKVAGGLRAVMGGAACAALLVMMVIAVFDVVARTAFNKPLAAASELIELSMVATIFLVYPLVSAKGMHISIDLLDAHLPDVVRRAQHVLANLLGAAVFAAIAWRIGYLAQGAWESSEVSGVLGIPLGHVYASICVLSSVTTIAFVLTLPLAFRRGEFVHPSMPIDEVPE